MTQIAKNTPKKTPYEQTEEIISLLKQILLNTSIIRDNLENEDMDIDDDDREDEDIHADDKDNDDHEEIRDCGGGDGEDDDFGDDDDKNEDDEKNPDEINSDTCD